MVSALLHPSISPWLTIASTVEPKNPLVCLRCTSDYTFILSHLFAQSQDSGNLVTITVKDYDLAEVSKGVKGVYTGLAMMWVTTPALHRTAYTDLITRTFLHLYLNYTQPLFIQAIMALKNLYDSKPVKIHILGVPAEGELKRPFKSTGIFGKPTIECEEKS